MRGEVAVQEDRRERDNDRLPESVEQCGGHHNQQIKQQGDGKQPPGPMCKNRDENDSQDPQSALQDEEYPAQSGAARTPRAEDGTDRDITQRHAINHLID